MGCSFSSTHLHGIRYWRGDPDSESAQRYLLARLHNMAVSFLSERDRLSERIKGNLGEFIVFCVGSDEAFCDCRSFAANALHPLSDISRPDIDLVWIYLDDELVENDFVIVQEVKTTAEHSLQLANRLIDDYNKLFGVDPEYTLHSRLQSIKNEFEYKIMRPDLCKRLNALAGISPSSSPGVRVVPTIVHDESCQPPDSKLIALRTTLVSLGWLAGSVEPWSVALPDLEERLYDLARGTAIGDTENDAF